jgi:hypothetical protein
VTEPATEWEVQPYDGWASLEDARAQWADAVDMDNDELTQYLASAYEQCVEFAPELAEGQTTIPQRLVQAQVMQARAIWRSLSAGDNNQLGPGEFAVTVYPMDWTVKNLLRPKRAVPRVG